MQSITLAIETIKKYYPESVVTSGIYHHMIANTIEIIEDLKKESPEKYLQLLEMLKDE